MATAGEIAEWIDRSITRVVSVVKTEVFKMKESERAVTFEVTLESGQVLVFPEQRDLAPHNAKQE